MSGLGEGVEPDGVKKLDNICQGDFSDHERVIITATFKLHVCNSATGWSDSGKASNLQLRNESIHSITQHFAYELDERNRRILRTPRFSATAPGPGDPELFFSCTARGCGVSSSVAPVA